MMANLWEFHTAPTTIPTPFTQQALAQAGGLGQVQTGLEMNRLSRNFRQRALPDLAGSQAAAGAFFSSATEEKARRLSEDTTDAGFDLQYKLGTTLADLSKSGVLAQIGVKI